MPAAHQPHDRIVLRPASAHDLDFLYQLHVATMREYVESAWGWDEEYQAAYFRSHFDPSAVQIITIDGVDSGMLSVQDRPRDVFLRSIELAPEFQGKGIGTTMIRQLVDASADRHKPVFLRVLKANPARRLYERLGFRVSRETPTHFEMLSAIP